MNWRERKRRISVIRRSELVVDKVYFDNYVGLYFWTPDGIGVIWSNNLEDFGGVLPNGNSSVTVVERLED
jgi:hypothetical protein